MAAAQMRSGGRISATRLAVLALIVCVSLAEGSSLLKRHSSHRTKAGSHTKNGSVFAYIRAKSSPGPESGAHGTVLDGLLLSAAGAPSADYVALEDLTSADRKEAGSGLVAVAANVKKMGVDPLLFKTVVIGRFETPEKARDSKAEVDKEAAKMGSVLRKLGADFGKIGVGYAGDFDAKCVQNIVKSGDKRTVTMSASETCRYLVMGKRVAVCDAVQGSCCILAAHVHDADADTDM